MVCDFAPASSLAGTVAKGPVALDAECLALGTAAVQHLVGELFALPSSAIKMGRLARLPPPSTPLPREKPLPSARAMTKWEKFAQAKGIVKKKRSKLEFDDEAGEWRRRYGYKRVRDESEIPIIEAKATDEVGEDAFASMQKQKKARVLKQEKNRKANLKQAAKAAGGAAISPGTLPSTLTLSATALPLVPAAGPGIKASGPPAGLGAGSMPRKLGKKEISEAATLASTATASMGKFDTKLKGAKPAKRTPKALKVLPVAEPRIDKKKGKSKAGQGGGSAGGPVGGVEKQFMQSLADAVIARNDTGQSMDVGKAISMLNKEKRGGAGGKGKDRGDKDRKKGGGRKRQGGIGAQKRNLKLKKGGKSAA